MPALSVQEDHPGKMTQALVCLSACVQRVLHVGLTEHGAFSAVNINTCPYLHGLL